MAKKPEATRSRAKPAETSRRKTSSSRPRGKKVPVLCPHCGLDVTVPAAKRKSDDGKKSSEPIIDY